MGKREFLNNLTTNRLERLVHIFGLEPKLSDLVWPERDDYIEVLANSRKATVENIKKVLKI